MISTNTITKLYLPEYIVKELPLDDFPRLGIEGEIDEIQVDSAFRPDKGIWYFMVPKLILKQLKKDLEMRLHYFSRLQIRMLLNYNSIYKPILENIKTWI